LSVELSVEWSERESGSSPEALRMDPEEARAVEALQKDPTSPALRPGESRAEEVLQRDPTSPEPRLRAPGLRTGPRKAASGFAPRSLESRS
jgi:hypothetical protein